MPYMCASPPDPSGEGGLTQRAIMPWRYVGGHDLLVHLKLVLHLDVWVAGWVGGWVGGWWWGTLHGGLYMACLKRPYMA